MIPPTPQRVLYVHNSADIYGASRSLVRLMRTLDRRRFEPLVMLPADGPLAAQVRATGTRVIVFPGLSVITRDVSDFGVFVECQAPISITKFRLVHFQLEREVRDIHGLPDSLRQGRLLSAVSRIQAPTRAGGRQGLALRLMVRL